MDVYGACSLSEITWTLLDGLSKSKHTLGILKAVKAKHTRLLLTMDTAPCYKSLHKLSSPSLCPTAFVKRNKTAGMEHTLLDSNQPQACHM